MTFWERCKHTRIEPLPLSHFLNTSTPNTLEHKTGFSRNFAMLWDTVTNTVNKLLNTFFKYIQVKIYIMHLTNIMIMLSFYRSYLKKNQT